LEKEKEVPGTSGWRGEELERLPIPGLEVSGSSFPVIGLLVKRR
jgi:hypothetical protein